MKVFKLVLAAMFFCASFSVHADASNATQQIMEKNGGKGQVRAWMNVNKPKAHAKGRTLRPVAK